MTGWKTSCNWSRPVFFRFFYFLTNLATGNWKFSEFMQLQQVVQSSVQKTGPANTIYACAPSLLPQPAIPGGTPSSFGVICSMGASACYSPHQISSQSSATHSQHQLTSATMSKSSSRDSKADQFSGSPVSSALSGTGDGMSTWKDFVTDNTPKSLWWYKQLTKLNKTTAIYVNTSLTKDLIYGCVPTDQQIHFCIQTLFSSAHMVREFSLFATTKFPPYDSMDVLTKWIKGKPLSNLSCRNYTKRSWASTNPYLIHLSSAAIASTWRQSGEYMGTQQQYGCRFPVRCPPTFLWTHAGLHSCP